VPRSVTIGTAAALLGAAIPVSILLIDHFSSHGWWPRWILVVWPSSYMMIAASGGRPGWFLLPAAISTTVNAALYALLAVLLAAMYRRLSGVAR
jgi:hypothetical protein